MAQRAWKEERERGGAHEEGLAEALHARVGELALAQLEAAEAAVVLQRRRDGAGAEHAEVVIAHREVLQRRVGHQRVCERHRACTAAPSCDVLRRMRHTCTRRTAPGVSAAGAGILQVCDAVMLSIIISRRDGRRTVVVDLVRTQVEALQGGVLLQHLAQGRRARVADAVGVEVERAQRAVNGERRRERLRAVVVDLVRVEVQLLQHLVRLHAGGGVGLWQERSATDAMPGF